MAIFVGYIYIFKLKSSSFTHFHELLFLFYAQVAPAEEIGCNACSTASCERIENPCSRFCRCKNDARQQSEWFLSRMFAA